MKKLIKNRCKCSHCGDIIESKHSYDFVRCKCGKIFIDGGLDDAKRGFSFDKDIIDLSEYKEVPDKIYPVLSSEKRAEILAKIREKRLKK